MISVCYTSARPAIVPLRVQEWIECAGDLESIEFVVTVDARFADHRESLARLPRTRVFVNHGRPCCVDGWNLAARKARGEILIQCSDDLHPPSGWDVAIHGKLGKGEEAAVLAISDGLTARLEFMPHAIMTRRYYNEFGYMFHDAHWSMFSDSEFTVVARGRNAVINGLDIQFRHSNGQINDEVRARHEVSQCDGTGSRIFNFRTRSAFLPWAFDAFLTEDGDSDGIYSPNWRTRLAIYWNQSPKTVEHYLGLHRQSAARRADMFGPQAPVEALQVLMTATAEHRDLREVLTGELARQGIELLVEEEAGGPMGERRNRLLARATAPYVTFVDDDEWVSHNYGEVIADAVANNGRELDVILHDVVTTIDDQMPMASFFTVGGENADLADGRVCAANHQMVWKRDIIASEPFGVETGNDDAEWSRRATPRVARWARVRGLLRFREVCRSAPAAGSEVRATELVEVREIREEPFT
jgi:hypothetical protein